MINLRLPASAERFRFHRLQYTSTVSVVIMNGSVMINPPAQSGNSPGVNVSNTLMAELIQFLCLGTDIKCGINIATMSIST
jgi:hypothetical protein